MRNRACAWGRRLLAWVAIELHGRHPAADRSHGWFLVPHLQRRERQNPVWTAIFVCPEECVVRHWWSAHRHREHVLDVVPLLLAVACEPSLSGIAVSRGRGFFRKQAPRQDEPDPAIDPSVLIPATGRRAAFLSRPDSLPESSTD